MSRNSARHNLVSCLDPSQSAALRMEGQVIIKIRFPADTKAARHSIVKVPKKYVHERCCLKVQHAVSRLDF